MTATTYTQWKVGDKINICGSVTEFCGTDYQLIRTKDINITKSPTDCFLDFGTGGNCGLHINNIELTFSIVKGAPTDNCVVAQTYKTLGSVRTNSDGAAGVVYTVTEQDRLNYISATNEGYFYYIMICITNGDGQDVSTGMGKSKNTDPITIDLTTGSINCTSTPSGAQIWFDGNNTDQVTPYTLTNISAQMHNITYKLTGYNDCDVNVTVIAGDTVNASCTLVVIGQEITDVELYYKVPWIYPKLYVDGVLYLFKRDFDSALAEKGYANYSVTDTVYNGDTNIITVTIKKNESLSINKSGLMSLNLITIPILIGIGLVTGIAVLAYLLIGMYFNGAKDVTPGVPVKPNRIITVSVSKKDLSGNCTALGVDANVSYTYNNTPYSLTIPAVAGFREIEVPEEASFTLTVTSPGLIHNLKPENLIVPADNKNKEFKVCFEGSGAPIQKLSITVKKTDGTILTCGAYILQYSESNSPIDFGELTSSGTIGPIDVFPDKKIEMMLVPCDKIYANTVQEYLTTSETMNFEFTVKNCSEAKNTVIILFQRETTTPGIFEPLLPDKVHITTQEGKLITLSLETDYKTGKDTSVVYQGLGIGTHKVKVVRNDSTIITDTQDVKFDKSCFDYKQLTFTAEPIVNTAEIIIEVVRSDDKTTIQGVYVYVDADTKGYNSQDLITNNIGQTPLIRGLSYSDHTFTLKRTGYIDVTHTLTIDSSTIIVNTLEISSELQIGSIDTTIINLISNVYGDLNAGSDVKFEGELVFVDAENNLKGLGKASINVTIKEGSTTVKQYTNILTDQKLSFSPGKFRTPTWTLPKSLAKKDLYVTAKFNGNGDYKSSSETQIFHVTEGCCLSLPLIGCIATQSTCNALKTGAYICGGLLIGYLGYKFIYKPLSKIP